MPCGERCKIILDAIRAMQQSVGCMMNSIILNAANGGEGPPRDMMNEIMEKMNEVAELAQRIATATPASGSER